MFPSTTNCSQHFLDCNIFSRTPCLQYVINKLQLVFGMSKCYPIIVKLTSYHASPSCPEGFMNVISHRKLRTIWWALGSRRVVRGGDLVKNQITRKLTVENKKKKKHYSAKYNFRRRINECRNRDRRTPTPCIKRREHSFPFAEPLTQPLRPKPPTHGQGQRSPRQGCLHIRSFMNIMASPPLLKQQYIYS